jgi:type I restriction enzyme, S subunit
MNKFVSTSIGLIPKDWSLSALSEITQKITDGAHFSPQPLDNGEIIANVKDMNEYGIDYEGCTRISTNDFNLLKGQNCSPIIGDVLLSKDGTIGRVVVYDGTRNIVLLSSIAILRPASIITSLFLKYILKSSYFNKQLFALQSGSALKRIVLSDINKLLVPFPQKGKQHKIAKILTTVDNLIEKTQTLIDKYQSIKQGMMHDLFTRGVDKDGKLRPIYEEAPHLFKKSELGWIPKEWSVTQLGKIARFNSGYAFKNHELTEHGMKVVRISNLHKREFPYWHYDGEFKETWIVEKGDLLFSWAGVASSIDAYLYDGEKALLNQHIYNFKIKNEDLKQFVFQFLLFILPKIREGIEGGAGQLHLSKEKIEGIAIPSIGDTEMAKILSSILAITDKTRDENLYLDKLKLLKSGLMQDLLTGKVRVKTDNN